MPTRVKAGARPRRARRAGKSSRAHVIAARLEAEIIAGKHRPHQRLVELELAARFRVSRAPVREALRLLEREGLVEMDARGAYVAAITPAEVADIFQILAHLEELYTGWAAPHVGAAELATMRAIVERMAGAVAAQDVDRYFELNIAFHAVIRGRCPNRKLIQLLDSLGKPTLRYRHLAMSLPGRLPVSLEEHRRVVTALAAGDATAAARHAGDSARRAFDQLNRFLHQNPHLL